jgi:exopolysaccharide biosynthesis polyprenyl glycosylphosphotransferase
MILDGLAVVAAVALAGFYEYRTAPASGLFGIRQGMPLQIRSMGILLVLLSGFFLALMLVSQQMRLYSPTRLRGFLHEQRLSVQACLTSGLLLTGTLYLLKAEDISRAFVLIAIGLATASLSLRRLAFRMLLYRRFRQGMETRNALIVGTGPEAQVLRHQLENSRHLGFTFKGFIDCSCAGFRAEPRSRDVVGSLDTLFQQSRKQFVDDIFFTTPCEPEVVQGVLEKARALGVNLRMVPDMYGGLAWNSPIEYIGQVPTIPLYCAHEPEIGYFFKRLLDLAVSGLAAVSLLPVALAIALAIKMDTRGPVFFASERIGKKGRVFRCIKFRTMVTDAERRLAEIQHMNERDGVLFKVGNDHRVTRVGRWLRKYSLDELPQFLNVLRGEMSVVGPRPPLAREVCKYQLNQLRRLQVTPGITGLWQVHSRQNPSFDSYVSLDLSYIENWSIWLDLKIMLLTVGVVFSGTGS